MKQKLFASFLFSLFCLGATHAGIRYVKANGAGDGSSWANASNDLQLMINQSDAGDEIRVAGGTYNPIRPDTNTAVITLNNRRNAFVMKSGVPVHGGYFGNGIFANLRAPRLYTTILDGDIGTLNDNSDNAYHLVLMLGGSEMVLDGFTIQNGNANGAAYTTPVNGYQIGDNGGAAFFVQESNSFNIGNCIVINNAGTGYTTLFEGSTGIVSRTDIESNNNVSGGHISIGYAMTSVSNYIQSNINFEFCRIAGNTSEFGTLGVTGGSASRFYNCAFTGNVVTLNYGTGVHNGLFSTHGNSVYGFPHTELVNCVFSGNKYDPAHITSIYTDTVTYFSFDNSIIWGDADTTDPILAFGNGTFDVKHSITQGQAWIFNSFVPAANIDADPQFVNAPACTTAPFTNGDYHITYCSPAVNSGSNSYLSSTQTTDMDSKPRISGGTVDMGIYELPVAVPDNNGIVYVNINAAPGGDGSSWDNAVNELADALKAAKDNNAIQQIWVAAGTYKPLYSADSMLCNSYDARKNSFSLRSGLKLLGGFAGSETNISQRNIAANPAILSGDIGTPGSNADNAYHIMVLANVSNVLIDGFTIKDGNANDNSTITIGGNPASNYDGAAIMLKVCGFSTTGFDIVINNCNISNNNSVNGGAICFQDAIGLLNHCNITNNTGDTTSALSIKGSVGMAVRNSNISGNTAIRNIVNLESFNGGVKFYNTIVSGNKITSNTYPGYFPAIFNNNSDTITTFPQGTEITNCTFSGNGFGSQNNAFVIAKNKGKVAVNNCAFSWNGGAYTSPSATCTYNNCIGDLGFLSAAGSADNIHDDPGFVNAPNYTSAPFTNGDYHLTRCSPAINAGNNSFLATNDTADFDNHNRISASITDIGAYEYMMGTPDSNGIVYVDSAAAPGGDGSSWTSAINEVADALKAAKYDTSIHHIYVAKGTYKPLYTADSMLCNSIDNRKKSFVLPDGITMTGGYTNGQVYFNIPSTSTSILSGDIGIADNNSDNSYHVVIAAAVNNDNTKLVNFIVEKGQVDLSGPSVTVDGITIGNLMGSGMANQANPQGMTVNSGCYIQYCTFRNNVGYYGAISNAFCGNARIYGTLVANDSSASGGGMANLGPGAVQISNSRISGNTAAYEGGGIYNRKCDVAIYNSLITGNYTTGSGGGIKSDSSNTTISNCTVAGNRTPYSYGGLDYTYNGSNTMAIITNSIFYDNSATGNADMDTSNNPLITVNNSMIGSGYNYGSNNVNAAPMFVNAAIPANAPTDAGDYHLRMCSPSINAGNNSAYLPYNIDMDGENRIQQTTVDLGAYEQAGYTLANTPGDSLVNVISSVYDFSFGCNPIYYLPYSLWNAIATANNRLILSVNQPAGALSNVLPIAFSSKLLTQYGTGTALQLANPFGQSGYYYPANRSWTFTINGTLPSPVSLRLYYSDTDSADIAAQYDFGSMQNLIVYKVNGTDPYDINATGYKEYTYAPVADTGHFTTGVYQGMRYVEFVVTGFSSVAIAYKSSTPLNIGLGDITATNVDKHNRIDWKTYEEAAGDKIILQRSSDGKSFTDLISIDAKGVPSSYTYWDEMPYSGMNYYRLKMSDANGIVTFSKIVSAFVNDKDAFAIEVFPNPASDNLTVNIYGNTNAPAQIIISDISGRIVTTLPVQNKKLNMNTSGWDSGIYLLKYADSNRQQIIKVVKQ